MNYLSWNKHWSIKPFLQVSFLYTWYRLDLDCKIRISLSYNFELILALYLGGTPSTSTGTRPPSCISLENHLKMLNLVLRYLDKFWHNFLVGYEQFLKIAHWQSLQSLLRPQSPKFSHLLLYVIPTSISRVKNPEYT